MTTVGGLPAHVLLVHAVVVLIPLAALLLVLVVLWPRAHRRLSVATAVVAVVALAAVPLTTDAGEWLERRVPSSDLVRTHTELGDGMLVWAIGLAVVAVLVAVWEYLPLPAARDRGPGAATAPARPAGFRARASVLAAVVALIAVVVAVGSVVTVYRIGESGARAAWTGQFSQQELPRTDPAPGGGE